jgi:hypothetical protein
VKFRSGGDPVLYLNNPEGVDRGRAPRRCWTPGRPEPRRHEAFGDPETAARIAQYEMAFRMQTSCPT